MASVIEAQNLKKTYGPDNQDALQGISFSVEKGEFYGLLGPNGAGKTTTISILCGLLRPSSGRAILFGRDATDGSRETKKLFGLVPQDIALYAGLTARENLTYFGRMQGLKGRELRSRVRECLDYFGLAEHMDRKVATFSGGMKRRANLCVALLGNPPILILDEPTVGIDVQSRSAIMDSLLSLNQDGITLIYTSHYMEEVERLCSRIAIMDHGRILVEGSRRELLEDLPDCQSLEDIFLRLTGRGLRD